MRVVRTTRSWLKPMSRVSRRRGRPSTTPSRSTKKTDSPGRFGCVTHGPQAAGDERQVRVGVARLHGALLRVEVVAALEPVVLVAGAFREQRPERLDVARNVLGAEPRRQAAVEEARGRVGRPVQAVRIGGKRLVFGGEMGPQLDDVESRLGEKLERKVERLRRHQAAVGLTVDAIM